MAQFKAFAPGVEVNGETVLSVVAGVPGSETMAKQILAAAGIADPQPGKWYPQQAWLDAFKKLADEVGPRTLQSIGKAIPENAKWPPTVKRIETAMPSIDIAYHMNHRGGDIGTYGYQKTGDRSGKMVCRNPYPCEFDRGNHRERGQAVQAGRRGRREHRPRRHSALPLQGRGFLHLRDRLVETGGRI